MRSVDYYRDGNILLPQRKYLRMPKPTTQVPPPLTPALFHILLALAEGPLHGYAVMQAVESSAGSDMRMGPGTIYGSLHRMEEAGLVKELATKPDDRRRVFALQPDGRRALIAESQRLARLAALVRARRLVPEEA
jgi:DNA-binding MarR family transcriptional regulator